MQIIKQLDYKTFVVDGGKDCVSLGDNFYVLGKKVEVINPFTKESLGFIDRVKGKIQVVQVYEKMCICKLIKVHRKKLNVEKSDYDFNYCCYGYSIAELDQVRIENKAR
ncbi:MAG: hypothetical protein N4A40_16040 [Tissierellales bacterium]|jgi:hypothetical protein|nr:hypothetical protein [Tissierellales bacterium]